MTPLREAAAVTAWRRTLSGIPTVIGQLAYLASLRDANTGIYAHVGLGERVGESEVDRVIRGSHLAVFQEWLCFPLERQKRELEEYFDEQGGDRREIISNWLALEPYAGWVPGESRDVERKLFHTDLAIVLEVIRGESGVASRDPDS